MKNSISIMVKKNQSLSFPSKNKKQLLNSSGKQPSLIQSKLIFQTQTYKKSQFDLKNTMNDQNIINSSHIGYNSNEASPSNSDTNGTIHSNYEPNEIIHSKLDPNTYEFKQTRNLNSTNFHQKTHSKYRFGYFRKHKSILDFKPDPRIHFSDALIHHVRLLTSVEEQIRNQQSNLISYESENEQKEQNKQNENIKDTREITNKVFKSYNDFDEINSLDPFIKSVYKHIDYNIFYHIEDEHCVIINDAFPKATHHVLVVPRDVRIISIEHLDSSHIPLLKHMIDLATELITVWKERDGISFPFRFGFHAIPSLKLMHMHIISQDFISDRLKNKKHWNSFNTDYFVDANQVLDILQKEGKVNFSSNKNKYEEMLKLPLTCSGQTFSTIPKLKLFLKDRKF